MSRAVDTASRVLAFGYRDRGGPLQRARATSVLGWCAAVGLAIAFYMNPIVLAGLLASIMVVAWRCRVLPEVSLAVAFSIPFSLAIALINPVVSQQGVTVLAGGVELPLLGVIDITSEALVYGLILALRTTTIFALCSLWVCCVSPDELLRLLRRRSVRSAITASLAVRFVPTLARDGANLALARACRPGVPPKSSAIIRAVFARSLERAGDSALALETRGFALAMPLRTSPPPRVASDWLLIASALLVLGFALYGELLSLARFTPYPLTQIAAGPREAVFALVLAGCAMLGVAGPRGEAR